MEENYGGNITGIAQQPDTMNGIAQQPETIIGKRPDDPLPHIRYSQQPHPMIDLSELISSIEKGNMYELFNLVLMVSSFTEAIKKSHPPLPRFMTMN